MSIQNPSVEVLHVEADPDDQSEFRILVDGKFTKYLTIDRGVYDVNDMCFAPSLISMLPPLPPGDWNEGHISQSVTKRQPYFASSTKVELPSVTSLWHPLRISHLDLLIERRLRSNICEVKCPQLDGSTNTVVAKFARFAWEIPQFERETAAYQWIDGHQIGPKFLGHISEEGRVIGFLIELILDARHAAPQDLPACQAALSRLHALGFKHGDINRHNILIRDGKATLIDFDNTSRCDNVEALSEEFQRLAGALGDISGKGGIRVVESGPE